MKKFLPDFAMTTGLKAHISGIARAVLRSAARINLFNSKWQ